MIKNKLNSMARIHTIFLFFSICSLLVLFFKFLSPFLTTLFMALICTAVIYPAYRFLRSKKLGRILSALIVFLTLIIFILVPLILLLNVVFNQATEVSSFLIEYAQNSTNSEIEDILNKIPYLSEHFPNLYQSFTIENIASKFGDTIGKISSSVVLSATSLLKNISFFILQVIIFLFAVFFFLIDGSKILNYVHKLIPLNSKQKIELFKKIYDLMRSIIFGTVGGAIVQSLFLGIGLLLAGVQNPLFWAMIGAVFSPVPYIGVAIVWIPIVFSLYLNNHFGAATFLLIWCTGLVSNIDNLVKSYLIGAKSHLHPFAVMLAILGGVLSSGFQGLIFGPFVLMLLLSFLHIYEIEYGKNKKI